MIVLLLKFHYISWLLSFWCHYHAVYKCHRNVAGISGFTIASNEVSTRLFTQSILYTKVLHHMWAHGIIQHKKLFETPKIMLLIQNMLRNLCNFHIFYKSSLPFSWSGTFECRNFFKRLTCSVVVIWDNFIFCYFHFDLLKKINAHQDRNAF